ncbi:MarR family winged helix-turn-helix transcriptional regulator [Roseomonas sp. CCTCC AB2023176]|uniref:MarR family winged helix-turn-helix transcriptional regulator n=1 Tax=Roseomonas sp. CCTCC AB2023176 TaxID=3342640 RepID=UPI0035DECD0D
MAVKQAKGRATALASEWLDILLSEVTREDDVPRPSRGLQRDEAGTMGPKLVASGGLRLGPLADTIGFRLRLAQEASFAAFARRTGHAELRPGRYALLTLIGENPGLSQSALSAAAGRDKSTLTPATADLERRGLIRRERGADRRSYAVTLTAEGEAVLRDLRAHAEAHDRRLDELVGPQNRPAFLAALRRLISGLEANPDEGTA